MLILAPQASLTAISLSESKESRSYMAPDKGTEGTGYALSLEGWGTGYGARSARFFWWGGVRSIWRSYPSLERAWVQGTVPPRRTLACPGPFILAPQASLTAISLSESKESRSFGATGELRASSERPPMAADRRPTTYHLRLYVPPSTYHLRRSVGPPPTTYHLP